MPAVPAPAVAPFWGRRGQLESARGAGDAVALRWRRGGDGGGGRAGWRGAVSRRRGARRARARRSLLPRGTSEEVAAEGQSPARAGARGERPCSPAGRRPAGALFRGWRCGRRCGPLGARSPCCAAPGRPAPPPPAPAQRCEVKSPAARTSVEEGLATGQTDSFDCSHPGIPRLPG